MPNLKLDVSEYRKPKKLPCVCVVCGQDAHEFPEKTFTRSPGWLVLLILFGLLGIILWIILTQNLKQTAKAFLPLCDEHLKYWRTRSFFSTLFVVIALGCAFAGVTAVVLGTALQAPGGPDFESLGLYGMLAGAAGFVFFLIVSATYNSLGIQPQSIDQYSLTLTKIDPTFIEEVREQRRKNKQNVKTGEPLDDDDDDYDD
jgi:hypothetical protein